MSERKGTKGLELWCKRLVRDCPEVQIDNMTTSWRNGIAFCALVHHFRPDLIDMSKLKPENIYENNQLAFNIAEKHLGIPSLLDPEDMVENDVPDRLSILTYLSQFYQRLSHTVNTKVSESESKTSVAQCTPETESPTIIRFGKTGLDKCTACGLPVYLAQRLIVSHKLYHRRCFRCSNCSGHINPKNYDIIDGSEISCDSCKNERTLSKYLNNNDHDQMGMLAFNDDVGEPKEPIVPKLKMRPQSILEKISLFEKNIEKDLSIDNIISSLTLKDNIQNKRLSNTSDMQNDTDLKFMSPSKSLENDYSHRNGKEKVYKSNIDKFNFLQTQLTGHGDSLDVISITADKEIGSNKDVIEMKDNKEDCINDNDENLDNVEEVNNDEFSNIIPEKDSNITDDNRIAKTQQVTMIVDVLPLEELPNNEPEIIINVPPRRKKQQALQKVLPIIEKPQINVKLETKEYPDHLNPFSDDEDEEGPLGSSTENKKASTNPFGSSDDEEDDEVPPIQASPKTQSNETPPRRRLIAVNPFWSDGEEHTSDEEIEVNSSKLYKSSITTSTPNLPSNTPRKKKTKAPPPPVIVVSEIPQQEQTSVSMDDIASISSLSSFNSENKSHERHTPLLKKRRPAPTPTDSLSTMSGGEGSMEHGVDTSGNQSVNSSLGTRRAKGPAPGLPLPERREVKLQMSPEELQVQLDLLETQQLGLERQGVLIEKMIRDKCEGDEASSVPQEEVEDLVIQLCELVNEKNDLFRKQTELMYIRRQQRLEQEQADIEHEIRVIQSRPAVNRIDADKVREEVLVSRLVEIVRMRDELVQQIDAERRRERQEDLAIAASIANKRAQRNNESNSSSMKSMDVVTPKKSKVKDKVKKQFKKVKHSVISKKKDDTTNRKEGKQEPETKSK